MLRHSIVLALSACLVTSLAFGGTAAAQSPEQAKTGAAAPDQAGNESSGAKYWSCAPGRQDACADYRVSAEVASNASPARVTRPPANAEAPVAPASSSAQASDEHEWRGFYVGVNLGGIHGEFSGPITIAAVPGAPTTTVPFRVSNTSFTGGGQLGYNWQINRTVIGIESEFIGMNLNGTQTLGATAPPSFVPGVFFSARSHFTTSLRGRLGYTWNNWLLYATGGVAFARTSVDANFILIGIFPASSGTDTNTLVGGTGGAGVEYALRKHWSIGSEYRYSGFQDATFHLGTVAAFGPPFEFAAVTGRVGLGTHQGTIRLNYKF